MPDEQVSESSSEDNGESGDEATQTGTVPQSRFNEVTREKNSLREELAASKAKIEVMESVSETEASSTDTSVDEDAPPSGLNDREKLKWYVEKDSRKYIEKELNMSLSDVKDRLANANNADQNAKRVLWENLCKPLGLDPNDRRVIAVAKTIAEDSPDLSEGDVMKQAADLFVKKEAPVKDNSGILESFGVSPVTNTSDWIPKDSADAARGAHEGKRAKDRSTLEVLAARKD